MLRGTFFQSVSLSGRKTATVGLIYKQATARFLQANKMDTEHFVRAVAGIFAFTGFVLGWFVNEWFYLIDAFVALNLLQSAFTKFCPLEMFHRRFLS